MVILSFGYKQPQDGDRGSIFFPALNFNIQQLNDHDHDGITSVKLTGASISGLSDNILAVNWLAVAGQPGSFYQDVNMPTGTLLTDYAPMFKFVGGGFDGDDVWLVVKKLAAAQYRVFINDNSQNLKVLYLV